MFIVYTQNGGTEKRGLIFKVSHVYLHKISHYVLQFNNMSQNQQYYKDVRWWKKL